VRNNDGSGDDNDDLKNYDDDYDDVIIICYDK